MRLGHTWYTSLLWIRCLQTFTKKTYFLKIICLIIFSCVNLPGPFWECLWCYFWMELTSELNTTDGPPSCGCPYPVSQQVWREQKDWQRAALPACHWVGHILSLLPLSWNCTLRFPWVLRLLAFGLDSITGSLGSPLGQQQVLELFSLRDHISHWNVFLTASLFICILFLFLWRILSNTMSFTELKRWSN